MSKIRKYNVLISYPIQVGAEDEKHVREILMASPLLRDAADLTLQIVEVEDE